MHPAPSLIAFTVLSGLGLGLMAWLGSGLLRPTGLGAVWWFGLAYGLAGAGFAASALHLGRPERTLRAFSQWRTSWLSREAVLGVAALLTMAPNAAASAFLGAPVPVAGWLGAVLALATVLATAMIYTQIKAVPRWHHWSVPAVFLTASVTGGAMLAGLVPVAAMLLPWLAAALVAHWHFGDRQFARAGQTTGTATGLGTLGTVRQFEPPHTGDNYLLREMVFVVGRKHARKLRLIALAGACLIPAALLWLVPLGPVVVVAAALHAAGMMAARWLFFAEAEHVVGLYYGRR
jgi:sulfite dehydrogenase (quinone) subunit SoeC